MALSRLVNGISLACWNSGIVRLDRAKSSAASPSRLREHTHTAAAWEYVRVRKGGPIISRQACLRVRRRRRCARRTVFIRAFTYESARVSVKCPNCIGHRVRAPPGHVGIGRSQVYISARVSIRTAGTRVRVNRYRGCPSIRTNRFPDLLLQIIPTN